MVTTKTVLLSALVAVLGFLAFMELQIVTVSFTFMPLYIPAKRSDVFWMLMVTPNFGWKFILCGKWSSLRMQASLTRCLTFADYSMQYADCRLFNKISHSHFHYRKRTVNRLTWLKFRLTRALFRCKCSLHMSDTAAHLAWISASSSSERSRRLKATAHRCRSWVWSEFI